jgi:hypothetical protein
MIKNSVDEQSPLKTLNTDAQTRLTEHLLYASEIVKTWPIWKQNCLGNLNEAYPDK